MALNRPLSDINSTPTRVVIFLFFALALIALMAVSISQESGRSRERKDPNTVVPKEIVNLSPHTLIYGAWSQNGSNIYAYDLATGREGVIANLPANIKKVSVLSTDEVLYINNINNRDHGTEIVKYNLSSKTAQTVLTAAAGYGIDDYVISPDKQSIASWEVQLHPQFGTLLDGKSRVYSARVSANTNKNLIYDEEVLVENPVRYPRAILNDGTVFMDRFLPNSGAGWAYGMSVSNFAGTDKQDLEQMAHGTYGTQPVLSPDGKYLVFGGYDGSLGSGTADVDGYRRALVTINTIELLDTVTRQRIKQPNLSSSNIYPYVSWNDENNLLVAIQGTTEENTGTFNYNITNKTLTPSKNPGMANGEYLIQELSTTAWLVGVQDPSPSLTGNLGETYDAPYTSFGIYNPQQDTTTQLKTGAGIMQFISVLPATSFGSFSAIIEQAQQNGDNLQLKTFHVKSELAPTRGAQQTAPPTGYCLNISTREMMTSPDCPRCRDLASTQCGEKYKSFSEGGNSSCWTKAFQDAKRSGQCYDSPLYLYGPEGMNVDITIHTPVSNSNVPYRNGYAVTLGKNGSFASQGKVYQSISYDYEPAVKRTPAPRTGEIVAQNDVEKTLREFAQKLALNEKETNDLLFWGKSFATGNYVQLSFYDHETSHMILPITFSPTPDVYRNIVFYVKNSTSKPAYSLEKPRFTPIARHGFTAVEISGLVE